MSKPLLYIDVDDTIYAQTLPHGGFDLRPGVQTQFRALTRLFRCRWLTYWGHKHLVEMFRGLHYNQFINSDVLYADWDHGHPETKAGYVLDPKHDQNFWWLEDPLGKAEIEALKREGKLDRYIPVAERGPDGFTVSCLELFRRAGITENDLKRVGARMEWFQPLTPGPHALPFPQFITPGEQLLEKVRALQ